MKLQLFGYELIIKKITKRSRYSRRSWGASETNTMLRFRNEGKSWKEVAQLLNRSEAACVSQYHKIKHSIKDSKDDLHLTEEQLMKEIAEEKDNK